jgi:L-ribulose-5-phosphate 3-epimerase
MKKGINTWSFPGDMTLRDKMVLAKNAGFQGFEPALDAEGELSLESSKDDILAVKKMADDIGIEITSLSTGLYWKYSPTSDDKEQRRMADVVIKKQIETASILGVKVILVVPGLVFASFAGDEVIPYDIAYQRALDFIKSNADYAKEHDITIGVENVWNGFLISPLEMRNFVDEIDSANVGVYFDAGNVIKFGYPEHWISILKDRIVKVHIKDYKRSVGTSGGFVDLLCGDVNFPEVMKGLKNVGYDDYIIAEMGGYNHYKTQVIYNTSASMTRILEGEK